MQTASGTFLWVTEVSILKERQSNKKQLYHNAASPDFLAKAMHQPVSGSWHSMMDLAPVMIHSGHVRNEGFHRNSTHFFFLMQSNKRPSSVSHSYSTQLPSPVNNKVSDEPRQRHGLPVCSQVAKDVQTSPKFHELSREAGSSSLSSSWNFLWLWIIWVGSEWPSCWGIKK